MALLLRIREQYMTKFPHDTPYIQAGIDVVPIAWVNQRLVELNENWSVEFGEHGYRLPALKIGKVEGPAPEDSKATKHYP